MTRKIIFSIIASIVGITAIIILLVAIHTDKKSEQEIESIDAVIASYDAPESTRIEESTLADKILIETSERKTEPSTEPKMALVEELAQYVIDNGINGDARKEYLGDRYDEVQKWIDANYVPPVRYAEAEAQDDMYYPVGGDGVLTPEAGVNYYNGVMETYYNLDMSGVLDIMYSLGYSGDYWVRSDGVKMFGNYVMVACDFGWLPRGSIVDCSLGTAIVCDTGAGGYGWMDIAVTW